MTATRQAPAPPRTRPGPGRRGGLRRPQFQARTASGPELLGWLGPSLLLVIGVVVYPLYEVAHSSVENIGITGEVLGAAGWSNYRVLLHEPDLPRVVVNTVIWVAVSVAVTTVLGLALAQLLSREFPLRRLVRAVVIVPWASSIVMTAIGFRWMLNYYYGALNPILERLHVIGAPVDWLGDTATIRWVMISVVVFISLPFTTMALLAGLHGIPRDVIEAAHIDGAGALGTYRSVILPLLRGPLVVTVLLNSVWIFNSFPVIYVLNMSNPGYGSDTTTTFMYKLSFITNHNVGEGAALSVLNVAVIGIAVALFVRRARLAAS